MDGNSRLGSAPSQYIGNCDDAIENKNGFEVRRVLGMNKLFAINTFHNAGPT